MSANHGFLAWGWSVGLVSVSAGSSSHETNDGVLFATCQHYIKTHGRVSETYEDTK